MESYINYSVQKNMHSTFSWAVWYYNAKKYQIKPQNLGVFVFILNISLLWNSKMLNHDPT
jgi:hypothetical protein